MKARAAQQSVRPGSRRRGARAGFTLVELAIVMFVLTVAVAMFSSTVSSTARWAPAAEQMSLAAEAARSQLERMRSDPFAQVFALYNADPSDDPLGPGTAPGSGFAVTGLRPVEGALFVGEVLFASPGPELREDVVHSVLGMPRDLSGDSFADEHDHAHDYVLLPALVRMRWQGNGGGERSYELYTVFVDLEATR